MLLIDQPIPARAPKPEPVPARMGTATPPQRRPARLYCATLEPECASCRWLVSDEGRTWLCGDPVVERRYCAEHAGTRLAPARRAAA